MWMSVTNAFVNLSIRNKIITGLLPLVLLMSLVGATSIQRFAVMNRHVADITENYLIAIGYLSDMRNAVMHFRVDIIKGVLTRTKGEDAIALQKRLDTWLARLDATEARYARAVELGEERQLYATYQAAWKDYLSTSQQVLGLLLNGRNDEAVDRLDGLVEKGERAVSALGADSDFNIKTANALADRVADSFHSGRILVLTLLGVAIALARTVGWVMVSAIAGPVQAMTDAMRRLADKDLQVRIPAQGHTDEIGRMAAAVEGFRENMVTAPQLAAAEATQQALRARRQAAIEQYTQEFGSSVSGV